VVKKDEDILRVSAIYTTGILCASYKMILQLTAMSQLASPY